MSPCDPQCRFTEAEAASIHELAQILNNGGNDNIRYLINVAKTMQMAHKVAWGTAITLLVGGFLKALYEGIKMLFTQR
jgi:hypothetical protein